MRCFRFLAFLTVAVLSFSCTPKLDVAVRAMTPETNKLGSEFEIFVDILNNTSERQLFNHLNIEESYLEGIEILGSVPGYYERYAVDIDNTINFSYDLQIDAGETFTVILYCKAVKIGQYDGNITAFFNNAFAHTSTPISTEITPVNET